jgi:Uma2 family endonuclease
LPGAWTSWGGSPNASNASHGTKDECSFGKFASSGANSGYDASIQSEEIKEVTMSTTPTLTTADELFMMPDDGFRYELVRGEIRRMPAAGSEHGAVIMNIGTPLDQFVKANSLGVVFGAETGFKIASEPDTVRAPDLAFVRRERIPEEGIPRGFWPGAPDLAVEVVSPGDTYTEVEEKVHDWLNAGTRMVLVLNPRTRTVAVYTSHTDVVRLTESDTLDGGEVLPGFTCRVAELFI